LGEQELTEGNSAGRTSGSPVKSYLVSLAPRRRVTALSIRGSVLREFRFLCWNSTIHGRLGLRDGHPHDITNRRLDLDQKRAALALEGKHDFLAIDNVVLLDLVV